MNVDVRASYDVRELEPASRAKSTYVLQEYFVPVERLEDFVPQVSEILNRHHVNAINISIRHARPDPGTLLAWARTEVFAYVLYYKQGTAAADRREVVVWTRELIDAAIKEGGAYYLPYQIVATPEQFHAAYPNADRLFELKRRVDPTNKFRNRLWDAYYHPAGDPGAAPSQTVTSPKACLVLRFAPVRAARSSAVVTESQARSLKASAASRHRASDIAALSLRKRVAESTGCYFTYGQARAAGISVTPA